MTTVSLEAAQLLKAAGYPQDQWPQMVWARVSAYDHDPKIPDAVHTMPWNLHYWPNGRDISGYEWCAAPDPLTALMWLAKQFRLTCNIFIDGESEDGNCWAHDEYGDNEVIADTPDALIIAICGRLAATAGTKAVVVE